MKNILIYFIFFALVSSCGRKTNPEPPEFRSPASVSGLVANATDSHIKLNWILPSVNLQGKDLNNLRYVTIKRKLYDSKNFEELIRLNPKTNHFFDESVELGSIYDYIIFVSNDQKGAINNIIRVNYQGANSKVNIIGAN